MHRFSDDGFEFATVIAPASAPRGRNERVFDRLDDMVSSAGGEG